MQFLEKRTTHQRPSVCVGQEELFQLILCRHEGGATFMAEAWGKLTGKPGVAMVTRGPGACNGSIGVHTAMQDSTPMVIFIGQVARDQEYREAFQEVDYHKFCLQGLIFQHLQL